MKKLTKLLLLKWHHYEKELISFDNINFLTGKTASGKSTIIDALQLVLLGDVSGRFFNKAANEKSNRNLESYLYCDEGEGDKANTNYLRTGDFTSYIVTEYEDDVKNTNFICGIVFDCHSLSEKIDHQWFIVENAKLPENNFIDKETKITLNISELRTFLRNYYSQKEQKITWTTSNTEYRGITESLFGQIQPKYRKLLKKAVPFSPIANIAEFITESICDIPNDINVSELQKDYQEYTDLQKTVFQVKQRIDVLQKIQNINNEKIQLDSLAQTYSYIIEKTKEAKINREKENFENKLNTFRDDAAKYEKEIDEIKEYQKTVEEQIKIKENDLENNPIIKKEKELNELKKIIITLEDKLLLISSNLKNYSNKWLPVLLNEKNLNYEDKNNHINKLQQLLNLENQTIIELEFDDLCQCFKVIKDNITNEFLKLGSELKELEPRKIQLEQELSKLEKGIIPYQKEIILLKEEIEQQIMKQFNKKIIVSPLAELLEIKDPKWRNAIEGYLGNNRFALLVPEEYYQFALKTYEEIKVIKRIFNIGIINIEALKKDYSGYISPNSLAEEIESNNQNALLYARYLLGNVIKCQNVEELKNHKIGITATAMLYKNYVGRNIDPKIYNNLFIGQASLKLQKEKVIKELTNIQTNIGIILENYNKYRNFNSFDILNLNETEQYKEQLITCNKLPELYSQKLELEKELSSQDLLYHEKLIQEISKLKIQKEQCNNNIQKISQDIGSNNEKIRNCELNIEKIGKNLQEQIQNISYNYSESWMYDIGEPEYRKAVENNTGRKDLERIFTEKFEQTLLQSEEKKIIRNRERQQYNQNFKRDVDVIREDNLECDMELTDLIKAQTHQYEEDIKNLKNKARASLENQFIDKIRKNIQSAEDKIDELNAALKSYNFGTDNYQFIHKPNEAYRKFYNMFKDDLLDSLGGGSYNLWNDEFFKKYKSETDELFSLFFMDNPENKISFIEAEERIEIFSNYKTYLDFDLEVINTETGTKQRLSKNILKKSGGETQMPFYISMLASFLQTCRIKNKNNNNTIRLVIFDEAFNKMDGERIRQSIKLLRDFGLQAIFSAPIEKAQDISLLADKNIGVLRDGNRSYTQEFTPSDIFKKEFGKE